MTDVTIYTPAMVKQAGTLTSATAINLGAAESGYRSFGTAVTDGDLVSLGMVHVRVVKDSTNWAIWLAIYTDAATDTLTNVATIVSQGTVGSSGAVTIDCVLGQPVNQITASSAKKNINGAQCIYTDIDTVQLGPGDCIVNGEWLSWTANISSGNLGQAAAGLSATGRWNWYLYNNSGTPALEFSQTVPVRSTDNTHLFKTGDASRRFVGYHVVYDNAGTREIFVWKSNSYGNLIYVGIEGDDGTATVPRVVSDPTAVATTFTAVGTTAGGTYNPSDLVPESTVSMVLKLAMASRTATGGAFDGLMAITEDSTLNKSYAQIIARIVHDVTTPTNFFLAPTVFTPLDPHTWYYAGTETTGSFTFLVDIQGAIYER